MLIPRDLGGVRNWRNIVDKFMKLSKTGFSVKCVRADFLQYSSTTVKIFILVCN